MNLDQSQKNQFDEINLTTQEVTELAEQLKNQSAIGNKPITDEATINRMIAGLADERGLIRRTFAESLGQVGKAALPGLLEVLIKSKSVIARRAAAKTLKLVGDPTALPYLQEALIKDSDPVVQGSSAGAMAVFGDDAIDYLLEVLIAPGCTAMQCGLASWALVFASTGSSERLKQAASSSNSTIKTAAIGALVSNHQSLKDHSIRDILINALDDSSAEVRAEATRLIINLEDLKLTENLLIKKLDDKDILVRKNSIMSLMIINSKKSITKIKEIAALENEESILQVINLAIERIKEK